MLYIGCFNQVLTGLGADYVKHFQTLERMPYAAGCAVADQSHNRTVPSEPPEYRFSPLWENSTVCTSVSWPTSL